MKFKILADSCCDLNDQLRKKLNISLVPLTIKIDDKEYIDNEELDQSKLLKDMENSLKAPQTASPSPGTFMKYFHGSDNIFIVTLSSALSSTYHHAIMAKNMFLEENNNKFIHVFDSLSASAGETMVSLKVSELIEKNCTNEEIIEKVNKYIKEMKTLFVLDSLDNLIKAGRINRFLAKIATVLSIKPIMGSENGSIKLVEKTRGTKKAFRRLVEIIGEEGERLEDKILGISHCNCRQKAEEIRDEIKKRYPFKEVIILETGGISTVYANKNGIIISF